MILEGIFALFSHLILMTGYVEKKTSFLPPLSKAEEKRLLNAMWSGDIGARETLVARNMRLVAHIAKKYSNYSDMDELISVGSVGLMKAINSYCNDKGTGLATYASRCIENEMLMVMRKSKKYSGDKSLYEPVSIDSEGNDITLIDLLSTDSDEVENIVFEADLREKLTSIVKRVLDEREYDIIRLRYGLEDSDVLTQKEIAKRHNISRSYISRIEKKALSKLRHYIECNNLRL